MRVFVYEFVTGGGAATNHSPTQSLLAEARAMAAAVTADFAQIPGLELLTTRDRRLPPFHAADCSVFTIGSPADEQATIQRLAELADWTLVIAPESERVLLDRCQWVLSAGGRLLSPGIDVVALASDKDATCTHLRMHDITTPEGRIVERGIPAAGTPPEWSHFPAIVKPIDGCGSQGICRIESLADHRSFAMAQPHRHRLEQFVPGLAASVAVLCGPESWVPLPACEQRLSRDGRFTYLGGRLPLTPALDRRARDLAVAAVRTLAVPVGYIGVDLVLGDSEDGRGDTVIEINPRLTTSYVGLRALCRDNLAAALLTVARGERPALSWHAGGLQFSADGRIVPECERQ